MALIKREPLTQPSLMNVAPSVKSPKAQSNTATRKQVELRAYWPSVEITAEAQSRLANLEIQYGQVGSAMQATIVSLVEAVRRNQMPSSAGFSQTPLMPMPELPDDISVVYQFSKDSIVIVDVRRPDQPRLF